MSRVGEAPATGVAVELALSDEDFEARYGDLRRLLDTAYRRRGLVRAVDRICGRLETLALPRRTRRPLEAPIFVTGSYRSGTTLLERILARHPALACFDHLGISFPTAPLTAGLLRRLFARTARATGASVAPDQPNMEVSNATPAECEPIWGLCRRNTWSDAPSHLLSADFSDPRFERLFVATVNKLLLRAGRPRFMNKNPLCTLRVGYLARLFPSARFVHLIRHPQRVVRSQLDLERMWARVLRPLGEERDWALAFRDPFMPPGRHFPRTRRWEEIAASQATDPALAVALSVADFQQAFELAFENGDLGARVLSMRYEDLVDDPASQLGRLFRHTCLEDEAAERIIADSSASLVDRSLLSGTSPLPRFSSTVEGELAALRQAGGYGLGP